MDILNLIYLWRRLAEIEYLNNDHQIKIIYHLSESKKVK